MHAAYGGVRRVDRAVAVADKLNIVEGDGQGRHIPRVRLDWSPLVLNFVCASIC